jgi:adenylate cyclase class 2
MAFEIELKAHLDDPEPVKRRLDSLGSYCGGYHKVDAYWYPAGTVSGLRIPPSGVRLRRQADTGTDGVVRESVLVTYKMREMQNGIEVNDEREFSVSGTAVFEDLLGRLGMEPGIRKEKQGEAWRVRLGAGEAVPGECLAELSLVKRLGWFIELEIIAENGDGQTVMESGNRLRALLKKLGVGEERIESRPYTQMLRDEESGSGLP